MLHAFLVPLLFLAPQGGPVQADLHPAEADVYVEFGDVAGVLSALDKAPLLRFVRDERLKELLTQLDVSPERSLKVMLEEGLAGALPEGQGGGWLAGLRTLSLSLTALGEGPGLQPPFGFLAVLDLETAEQAEALHALVESQRAQGDSLGSMIPGLSALAQSGAGGAMGEMWSAAAGPRLLVGNASSSLAAYQKRTGEKGTGLAGRESLQKPLARLEKASGTPILFFYLGRGIRAEVLDKLPAGLNPFAGAVLARMQFNGERFITEMVSAAPAETTAQAPSKPVDPAWLEPVPKGSMLVYAGAFDGVAAGKRVRELLAMDEHGAASLAALEQKLGFGPEKVLARLGPGLTLYMAPLAGLGLPETRVWVDCDDPAAFTTEYEALIGALGDTLPGFQAKTRPYKLKQKDSEAKIEVPVTTLTLPADAIQIPMISLAPSFAPVGKKLVFGLSSMDVKNELKRVHSGDGEPIVSGVNPLKAMGFQLPAGASSCLVMDWGGLMGSIIGTVKAFAGMAGPDAFPFDLKSLPPTEMFTQHFKPTFHYSLDTPGGSYCRNEASFGPETWLGLVLAGLRARSVMGSGMMSPGGDF